MTYAEDPDDLPCDRCGRPVHLHDDPVCPHGYPACEDCGHEAVCRDCRHNAELLAGLPTGIPHDLDPAPHIAALAAWREQRRKDREASGYDPVTNSYRRNPS